MSIVNGRGHLAGLRAFYRPDEQVSVSELPAGTRRVVVRQATGKLTEGRLREEGKDAAGASAHFGELPHGTHSVEALGAGGLLLAEEFTSVGSHPGERPVHGFATSFDTASVPATLEWIRALRCTVVQIYDWMERYAAPLGPPQGWKDPSGRPVSYEALRSLVAGIRGEGGVAHAYSPVYAADIPFAAKNPSLVMYRGDGGPQRFFENIQLADPSNPEWQRHFSAAYGAAADEIGFNGFHLDTYGYPRSARGSDGTAVDMRAAYQSFLRAFRAARPSDLLSFNQVNGVPSALTLPQEPVFRYCEVWPPNDRWRHLEALLDRSAGVAGRLGAVLGRQPLRGTIACYPAVWGAPDGEADGTSAARGAARAASLRTVVLTEAIATCLGAAALLYGDRVAALCDPYYPKHQRLLAAEAETVLEWHRFALRCRDLFLEGEDTSWYDIGDENGAVEVQWDGAVSAEPLGGGVLARVSRDPGWVAIAVVDLSGNANGSWSEPTQQGRCRAVRVRVLLDEPGSWQAAAAVLGRDGSRFEPLGFRVVGHREGLAAEVDLPLGAGWSVLRMTKGHHDRDPDLLQM